jgi:hypothetical protein
LKGVPVRAALGMRDLKIMVEVARRDTKEKQTTLMVLQII